MAVKNSIKLGPLVFLLINICNHGEHYEKPCISLHQIQFHTKYQIQRTWNVKSVLFKKYFYLGILLQNLSHHTKQKSLLYLRIKCRNTFRLPLNQIELCTTGTHLQNKTKKGLSNWIQIWLLRLLKTAEHNDKISFLMRLPPVMICKIPWLLIVLAMVTESLADIASLHECTTNPHGGIWVVTGSDRLLDPRSRKWRFTRPPAHWSSYLALQRCWWRRIALAELELVSFDPQCTYKV